MIFAHSKISINEKIDYVHAFAIHIIAPIISFVLE